MDNYPVITNPFSLTEAFSSGPLLTKLLQFSETATGLKQLGIRYQSLPKTDSVDDFCAQALKNFNISYHLHGEKLDSIPKEGPTLVVANHPYGVIEGIILMHLLCRYRPDCKVVANSFLGRVPELKDVLIGVDPYDTKESVSNNRKPMIEAARWLKKGGLLIIFPAGDVAKMKFDKMRTSEGRWDASVVKLARISAATTIPIFFPGRNSKTFHSFGLIHPRVRTVMLPRELLNKQNRCFSLHIGKPVAVQRLEQFDNDNDAAKFLRMHTMMLGRADDVQHSLQKPSGQHQDEIIPALDRQILKSEIDALNEENRLFDNGDNSVCYASAQQIPNLLQEIGRLRELTFREVGEGTGKSLDLDHYDQDYLHLFIWNHADERLVGAYRMGLSDQLLEKNGKKGFYSNSLFKYSSRFIKAVNPAIELGRSFICKEYQRSFAPLMLLWKGIGHFVAKNPQYCLLFGPVSISNEYHSLSQKLIVDFLEQNTLEWGLRKNVRARSPWKPKNRLRPVWRKTEIEGISSIENISELVSVIEQDNKGVPILLRQYLKLGGKMLGFNVDKDFSDCLDGLVLVDLRETDRKVLQRYMGKSGMNQFLSFHKAADLPSQLSPKQA